MNDTHDNDTRGHDTSDTEQQLREAVAAFADTIHPAKGAYHSARREWRRREQRRRMSLAVLITLVFALATLIGLWVLNEASTSPHSVFGTTVSVPSRTCVLETCRR